ncbi:hypothetical protein I551_0107 [Mycobacterium ulcerans str. Harvey]|uniref:Uncharacterized protein n=1 Tax=Mycobacterium ulcerans str. Harvey TaxID=1299332 RepID=A0ABN0R8R6_MYCUL|nr:hypothetical protein I551_0107 [Mycobacterium ulcerans str. Harvey]
MNTRARAPGAPPVPARSEQSRAGVAGGIGQGHPQLGAM